MFEPIFEWAGKPRRTDVGPGGICNVVWPEVRPELSKFCKDTGVWLSEAIWTGSTLAKIAALAGEAGGVRTTRGTTLGMVGVLPPWIN